MKSTRRTCRYGHLYYKSSDCPNCPICEELRVPLHGFLSLLAAPARRALENKGITTIQQLIKFSEEEICTWHGIGDHTINQLKLTLKQQGLSFAGNHNRKK